MLYVMRLLRLDKNTASDLMMARLGAAPLTCCGEERRDRSKVHQGVKKNLNEKKKDQFYLKKRG
jgi:hypothetical protein